MQNLIFIINKEKTGSFLPYFSGVLPGAAIEGGEGQEKMQKKWSEWPESNRRQSRWQRDALPAELHSHLFDIV